MQHTCDGPGTSGIDRVEVFAGTLVFWLSTWQWGRLRYMALGSYLRLGLLGVLKACRGRPEAPDEIKIRFWMQLPEHAEEHHWTH